MAINVLCRTRASELLYSEMTVNLKLKVRSGNFQPEVGPAGSHVGMFAAMYVDVVYSW